MGAVLRRARQARRRVHREAPLVLLAPRHLHRARRRARLRGQLPRPGKRDPGRPGPVGRRQDRHPHPVRVLREDRDRVAAGWPAVVSGQPATPGQRAYEAHAAMVVPRPWRWDQLDDKLRAAWDAAAQAVLNDAFPGLKRELAEAQARLDTSRELHRLSRLSAAGDESELRHIHETLTIAYGREDLSEETATVVEAMAAERARK